MNETSMKGTSMLSSSFLFSASDGLSVILAEEVNHSPVASRIFYACLAANLVKDAGKVEAEGEGDNRAFSQSTVKAVHDLGCLILVTLGGRSEYPVVSVSGEFNYQVLVAIAPPCKDQVAVLTVEFGGDATHIPE